MSTPFNGPASRMPIAEAAASFNQTVEAYKAEIIANWSQPIAEAYCGAEGYGYRVVFGSGGMDWRIFWSDGSMVRIPRIVRLCETFVP